MATVYTLVYVEIHVSLFSFASFLYYKSSLKFNTKEVYIIQRIFTEEHSEIWKLYSMEEHMGIDYKSSLYNSNLIRELVDTTLNIIYYITLHYYITHFFTLLDATAASTRMQIDHTRR